MRGGVNHRSWSIARRRGSVVHIRMPRDEHPGGADDVVARYAGLGGDLIDINRAQPIDILCGRVWMLKVERDDRGGDCVYHACSCACLRLEPDCGAVAQWVPLGGDNCDPCFPVVPGVVDPVRENRRGLKDRRTNDKDVLHVGEVLLHVVGVGHRNAKRLA